jgi:hypothetical protein
MCHSSFLHTPDRPDFKRTDRSTIQTHMEAEILSIPELHNEMANDMCIGNYPDAGLKALGASTPMSRPCGDPRLPIPAPIHYIA